MLRGFKDVDKVDYIDWYDHKKVKKINYSHSRKWLKIYKKIMDARDSENAEALDKAREEMRKHEEKGREYEQKANATGYYWI